MLSPKTQTNLRNAKSYFQKHLCVGDYYMEGLHVSGNWMGKGATMLGLEGTIQTDDFLALCENTHPNTKERLTVRTRTTRRTEEGGTAADRRIFFDFAFSPPKSVSVAALVLNDERIVAAHSEAVKIACEEMEQFVATRVRAAAANHDRITGNLIGALFQHDTSRALDPHLHTHFIIFNATHDAEEKRWKALQNHYMLKARKFVENVYYHELGKALLRMGYTVKNLARGDFEIENIPLEIRERFSKRHEQINQQTKKLLREKKELISGNLNDAREYIANKYRPNKVDDLPKEKLRAMWLSELTSIEATQLRLPEQAHSPHADISAATALDWAGDHLFERRSVIRKDELYRHALEYARGSNWSIPQLKDAMSKCTDLVHLTDGNITRHDVMEAEQTVVDTARDGRGTCPRFVSTKLKGLETMEAEQSKALEQILCSRDLITLFRGGAGTGKSYLLKRVQANLERVGNTFVIAPQRQQVIDLERDGFTNTQTVSEFLQRKPLREGATVIVDEAGQIGIKQMSDVLTYAKQSGCRVILSGDTRQHGSVACGDALRAIEKHSGCQVAELETIRRQDPALGSDSDEKIRITRYRDAVKAAADGNISESFNVLEKTGAIRECQDMAPALSDSYLKHVKSGETALVVSQTRDEVKRVNDIIRNCLKRDAHLQGNETVVSALEQIDLTGAQKLDARYYPENAVVILNRDASGFIKGQLGKVLGISDDGAVVECEGKIKLLPPRKIDALTICQPNTLILSRGDRIQLKANGKAINGEKLANGEVVTVRKILKSGEIKLDDCRILPANFRQFVRGYAVTSYGSQGKTVDHVIFADSAVAAATNAQQWYVTISRGRKSVEILTADRKELRRNILRESDRKLVIEHRIEVTPQRRIKI